MLYATPERLKEINKALDDFSTHLSPELTPTFNKIRDQIIETTISYYVGNFIKSPESLIGNLHVIIVMKSFDAAQKTKAKSTKEKLDKIRMIALELIRESVKNIHTTHFYIN